MQKALFSLKKYNFPEVKIDFVNFDGECDRLDLDIETEGVFYSTTRTFNLKFKFRAINSKKEKTCVEVLCLGEYVFKEAISLQEVPIYFYANSIAILFPYVRAFVSTVTLQANYPPIVLPTMNLSSLSEKLRDNVQVVD